MKSPAMLMFYHLVGIGIASDPDSPPSEVGEWPCFIGTLPDTPDCAICCYDTTGKTQGRYMRGGKTIEFPGIQVRIRALDYAQAYNKAVEIMEAMDAVKNQPVEADDERYAIHSISHGTPMNLGQDVSAKSRSSFTVNAMMSVTQLS